MGHPICIYNVYLCVLTKNNRSYEIFHPINSFESRILYASFNFFLFLPFAKENRKKRQHLKKERSLHVLIKHRLMKDIQDLLEKDSFFFFFFFNEKKVTTK